MNIPRINHRCKSHSCFFGCKSQSMGMSEDEKYPSELAERFQVRMPEGLRDRIRQASERTGRSMNSEIVLRLEQSFVWPQERLDPSLMERIQRAPALKMARVRQEILRILEMHFPDDTGPTDNDFWEFGMRYVLSAPPEDQQRLLDELKGMMRVKMGNPNWEPPSPWNEEID